MTITIDLSEEVAAAIAEEARQQGCSTTELVAQEIRTRFLVTAPGIKNHSIMEFRGIGAGRPGAIGSDIDTYVQSMRDEWKERETRWRHQ